MNEALAQNFGAENMPEIAAAEFACGQVAWFATANPHSDRAGQDRGMIWSTEKRLALVIADGAGGMPSGDRAAEAALQALRGALQQVEERGLRTALVDGFEWADRSVVELGLGAATTLVCAAVEAGELHSIHAGDSACLVVGQRGVVRHETIAHSPVGYGIESGLIDAEAALVHEDRHIVSNLLGCGDLRIEIGPRLTLRVHDTALLASDGLFDNIPPSEIIEIIRSGPLERAARTLRERCQERMANALNGGKPDDLSLILFRPHRAR